MKHAILPALLLAAASAPAPATDVPKEFRYLYGSAEAAAITRESAVALGLQAGDQVKAVIKSTEVMIDKP